MKVSADIERDTAAQTTTAAHNENKSDTSKIRDPSKKKSKKANSWSKDTMITISCASVILAVLAIMMMVMLDMRTDIRDMQAQVYIHIPNELRRIDERINERVDDTNERIDDTNKRIDALQESLNERIDTVIQLLLANQ